MSKKTFWKPTKMKVDFWKDQKRYGDDDLDGTPNRYDCDPRDASKDSIQLKMAKKLERAKERGVR